MAVCWLLAAVFALALQHKVGAWLRFQAAFQAYRIVPSQYNVPAAASIVVLEFVAVLALVVLQPVGLLIAASLLALYAVAIAVNLGRGRRHIDCGCGDEPAPVSLILVARNLLLIAMAAGAYVVSTGIVIHWQSGVVAFASALVAFGIYIAIEQLVVNRGRHARLWLGVS